MENASSLFFYIILFGAIFYFLIYRPQQKQKKKRQELFDSLEVNKDIVTIGGIHGKITQLDEDTVTLKIADGVEIQAQKNAVGYIADEESDSESTNE